MGRAVVVPGSMSPVSPTLETPLASSSIRLASPSKETMGNESAGVFVARTTHSWVLVPSLVTTKVTLPDGAAVADRWMYMWLWSVSPRATVTGVEPLGVDQKS